MPNWTSSMSWLARLFERKPSVEVQLADALVAWQAGEYGVALDLWAPLAHDGVGRAHPPAVGRRRHHRGVVTGPDGHAVRLTATGHQTVDHRKLPELAQRGLPAVGHRFTPSASHALPGQPAVRLVPVGAPCASPVPR